MTNTHRADAIYADRPTYIARRIDSGREWWYVVDAKLPHIITGFPYDCEVDAWMAAAERNAEPRSPVAFGVLTFSR